MQHITLDTSDHIKIVANYYPGSGTRGVILVHMMPATKESWAPLIPVLSAQGFHVIAIDLRGHGESVGGPEGYKEFADVQHGESKFDVEAAARFLEEHGASDIAVIGASIGANLAVQYLAEHADAHTAVLLSPGIDYYGVETLPLVSELGAEKRIFFVASEDDVRKSGNNCAEMAKQISNATPGEVEKKILLYKTAGHGTDMFGKEGPDLVQEIGEFISSPL